MQKKNIKVITTSRFDNGEIKEYLEPISSHVVIGMNIFKDLFSGLTDIFGGHSTSYEKTLSSLNEKALNQLREKAQSLGANAIIGMSLDIDEIGAQGKSMMMITATGTAVRVQFEENTQKISDTKLLGSINRDTLKILYQKKLYIQGAEAGTLKLDNSFWAFIKEYQVGELAEFVLSHLCDIIRSIGELQDEKIKSLKANVTEFFKSIDDQIAVTALYKRLETEENKTSQDAIAEIIIESYLVDFDGINTLIKNHKFATQKIGVKLGSNRKLNYSFSDIEKMESFVDLLKSFEPRGEKATKKKMLSSKEVEIWRCECGNENSVSKEHCSKCDMSMLGFSSKENNPHVLANILESHIEILKENIIR